MMQHSFREQRRPRRRLRRRVLVFLRPLWQKVLLWQPQSNPTPLLQMLLLRLSRGRYNS